MWTPKRVLIVVVGFLVFFSGYLVYAHHFGQFDGLPPLPSEHKRGERGKIPERIGKTTPLVVRRLIEAFGPTCEEQERSIKLQWHGQGVVIAAGSWKLVEETGQLKLTKVSVAIFGKPRPNQKGLEISTIRGQEAYIEFDQPLRRPQDAQHRRPVGGRVEGDVWIRNNRRTPLPQDEDDLHLYTDWLAYREDQHRLWTDASVRLIDGDPAQATIIGTGMEVILVPNEKPGDAAAKKGKPTVGGIKTVRLDRDVVMDLLVDAKSGFLGSGPAETAPSPGPNSRPAKTPVVIRSAGRFFYQVEPGEGCEADRAEFTQRVNVIRRQESTPTPPEKKPHPEGTYFDQLDCEQLVLQFRRHDPGNAASVEDRTRRLDLVSAHATGPMVELSSDAERLHATGTDLFYDAGTRRTVLKGEPLMTAERDGSRLWARSLTLETATEKVPGNKTQLREVRAQGPGEIKLRGGKDQSPRIARWRDELRSSKDGGLDKLVLTGQAFFEDVERGRLQAEVLTVWLDAAETPGAEPDKKQPLPRRLEAVGNVTAVSPEFWIHKADVLRMRFEDVPRGQLSVINGLSSKSDQPPAQSFSFGVSIGQSRDEPEEPPPTPYSLLPTDKGEYLPPPAMASKKSRQPIELEARSVDVAIVRDGNKSDLKELFAEGQVHVTQQAEPNKTTSPDDKAVDIEGETLLLTHSPLGNVLHVTGPANGSARVQLEKLFIVGPTVDIDQPNNQASVKGIGSLRIPTKTDLDGKPLAKPVDLIIHWKERMLFDGSYAEFDGGVQANEGPGTRLVCHTLKVIFEKPVSLQERPEKKATPPGQPKDEAAAIRCVMCDSKMESGAPITNVRMDKEVREGERLRELTRIQGTALAYDKGESTLKVSGPGVVRLFQAGSRQADPLNRPGPAKPEQAGKANDEEMKLTIINFKKSMFANQATRTVIFHSGTVDLVHLPSEDPDVNVNPDNLPPRAFWLQCTRLQLLSHKIDDKTSQDFKANGRVRIKAQDFYAEADVVKYDESKDLLILSGEGANAARLWKQKGKGLPWETAESKEIWFYRKEGRFRTLETRSLGAGP